eukprot:3777952-Pleurochrysis_carterae.AAC.1
MDNCQSATACPPVRPLDRLSAVAEPKAPWGMVGGWNISAAVALGGVAIARAGVSRVPIYVPSAVRRC